MGGRKGYGGVRVVGSGDGIKVAGREGEVVVACEARIYCKLTRCVREQNPGDAAQRRENGRRS